VNSVDIRQLERNPTNPRAMEKLQALANISPERIFVRWYRDTTTADALFQSAVDSANGLERVEIFEFDVRKGASPQEITAQAERVASGGDFVSSRSYKPN